MALSRRRGWISLSSMNRNTPLAVLFTVAFAVGLAAAQPFHPAVDAFFSNPDPFIQGTVIPNIEKNRKSEARIAFTDADGRPLPGLEISVRQTEHDFPWGAVPPFERSLYATPEITKLWRDIYNY